MTNITLLIIYGIYKKSTNEVIYKTETELQMWKANYGYQGVSRGEINWETGVDTYTLLYIIQITDKDVLYSMKTLLNTL